MDWIYVYGETSGTVLVYYSILLLDSKKTKTNTWQCLLQKTMAPRKPVKTLQNIALNEFMVFFASIVEWVSKEIILQSRNIENGVEYRKTALLQYVSELSELLMPTVVPSVLDDVVDQILNGVRKTTEKVRATWQPGYGHFILGVEGPCTNHVDRILGNFDPPPPM